MTFHFVRSAEQRLLGLMPARWQALLRGAHDANKALLRSGFWLALFVLGAKSIAALKEIVVAYRYGTSEVLDAYLLLFNLANWPISLLYGVMGAVLVPALVRLRQDKGEEGSKAWQRQITAWVWVLALGLTLLTALGLPAGLASGWLGLSPAGRAAALELLPWLAAMVGLGIVASWHACQLMSGQRHANTFLEGMPALAILLAVLAWPEAAAAPLLWGTLAGFALQTGMTAWAARRADSPVAPGWPPGWPLSGPLVTGTLWLLAGQALMGLAGIIDQTVLAHLPPGSLAAFGYANRVMALVLTLSATVVGRAMLPVLAGLTDAAIAYEFARRWAWRLFWLGLAGAVVVAAVAQPAVALLFERGAFTPDDTAAVARLLALMALQLPLSLLGTVWVQWTLAQPGLQRLLWWAAVGGVVAKLAVMATLVAGLGWGAEAVVMGLAAVTVGSTVVLMVGIRRYRDGV